MSGNIAQARIVDAFYITGRGWAITLDGLEGVVKRGQLATLQKGEHQLGPIEIHGVEFADKRREKIAWVALVLPLKPTKNLKVFSGGYVKITQPLDPR